MRTETQEYSINNAIEQVIENHLNLDQLYIGLSDNIEGTSMDIMPIPRMPSKEDLIIEIEGLFMEEAHIQRIYVNGPEYSGTGRILNQNWVQFNRNWFFNETFDIDL